MKRLFALTLCVALLIGFSGCNGNQEEKPVDEVKFVVENSDYSYEAKNEFTIDVLSDYDEEYLTKLREKYKLDEMVADCKTDFDKVLKISEWVTNLWAHDGMNQPEKNDPLYILDEVTENNQRFRCVEYGTVIVGCLTALDIPARGLGLKMKDVETIEMGAGHVAAEVYLKDLGKWIFVDGQWGTIPTYDDVPLNALEFSTVLKNNPDDEKLTVIQLNNNDKYQAFTETKMKSYYSWIRPYLYYFDTSCLEKNENNELVSKRIMLTPTGAKEPTIFQIKYTIEMDIYTDSATDFYQPPVSFSN